MLIDEPAVLVGSVGVLGFLSAMSNREPVKKVSIGVYEIGHFGSSDFLRGYEHYPDNISVPCYGVCDSVDQLLLKCPELNNSSREFVVTVHRLNKKDEPESGGWRWHKWGDYIGDHTPTTEYLHDEPIIEEIFVYHIYEKI